MARLTRKHWAYIIALIVIAGLVALWMRPDTFDVDSVKAGRGPLRVTIDEQGVTRIHRHTELTAPITGRMAASMVTEGDHVNAGMAVARVAAAPLDPRARAEAVAAIQEARSMVGEAESRVVQAKLALEEARRERSRTEQLAAAGAVAPRDLEKVITQEGLRAQELDAARARARAASQEEQRLRTVFMGADPTRSGTGAFVDVRSPIKGVVLRVFEEHERVIPAGTPIMEIGDPAGMELVVDVLTRDAALIPPNALMIVTVAGSNDTSSSWQARVKRIDPAAFTKVSPLGIEEQRVNVIGQFDSLPPGIGDKFEAGVSIVLWESQNVLRIPSTALVPVRQGWAVFVIEDKKAHLRSVKLGHRGSRSVEVNSGIKEGDTIVIHPDERLYDGARVKTK